MIAMNPYSFPALALLACSLLSACGGGGGGDNGGNTTGSTTGGTTGSGLPDRGPDPYIFSTEPLTTYKQVDRMGAPVVATVLLPTAMKDSFNQNDPVNDGDYNEPIVRILERLHLNFDDDIRALGLTPCPVDVCLRQAVPEVIPDVLHLKLDRPDGFPNGRRLEDAVVDRILAFALLDMTTPGVCRGLPCSVDSFVNIPLNPMFNEARLLADFPYFGASHPPP